MGTYVNYTEAESYSVFWYISDNVQFCGNPQKDVFDDVYKLGCRL